jgi:hypothetical protein
MSTTDRHQPAKNRPTFTVRFRAEPGVNDPIKALRALLKIALRRLGLRAVDARGDRGG